MQKQYSFGYKVEKKPLTIRTTDEKRDLLKVVAARHRKSVNKLVNDWMDTIIETERLNNKGGTIVNESAKW